MKRIFFIALIGCFLLSCESGINLNLQVAMKTTTHVIKLEGGRLGNRTQVLVNHTWTWIQKPTGDSVVVERSLDSLNWEFVTAVKPITDEMTCTDTDSLLPPGDTVWYRLSYLSGTDVYYFIYPRVVLLPSQHFNSPAADTISDTLLHVDIAPISGINEYVLALYQADVAQPESLLNLMNPVWIDTLVSQTLCNIPIAGFANGIYTLKVSSTKIAQLNVLSDGTHGFRAFVKIPAP